MLKKNPYGFECFLLFLLLLQSQLLEANAAAPYAQFKREQQPMQQQKSQQQPTQNLQPHAATQSQAVALHSAQGMSDKDAMPIMMKHTSPAEVPDPFVDPYQMLHELKHEQRLTAAAPPPPAAAAAAASMYWNPNPFMNQMNNAQMPPAPPPPTQFGPTNFGATPYSAAPIPFAAAAAPPLFETPKFYPFFGFPQPMFIPMPLFYPPPTEMLYSMYPTAMNNFEDAMSRAGGGRRPASHARDSPIYYMRLPPTPYMFLPNFGYTPATPNFGASFSPFFTPYQPMSAFSGLSPTFNLPLSFLANGKPSGIYQMTSPPTNELQNSYGTGMNLNNFNTRPSMQSNGFNGNYAAPSYGIAAPASSQAPVQDSRMTLLKQPFIFNGRPDEMYILQNSFNPMYGGL